jgi:hypothetical protein
MTGVGAEHLKLFPKLEWLTFLLGMLITTHVENKFLVCYGTRIFITLFTKDCHWIGTAVCKIHIT